MTSILYSLWGPRLIRIFKTDSEAGRNYIANPAENLGDTVVKWMRFCWSVSYWGSPVLLTVLYRRGYFTPEGITYLCSYAVTFSTILVIAVTVRAIGRSLNSDYTQFLRVLRNARVHNSEENKKLLERYDFEFWAWPANFRVPRRGRSQRIPEPDMETANVGGLKGLVVKALSYVSAHTFGVRMVYPGQTAIINTLVGPALAEGRVKLVEQQNGVRAKVVAADGNEIETMFVDRRGNESHENGNQLVICCEGNSGFYEIGCTVTPLGAGYSVLGWNHPGFGGSSGKPFPSQEQDAVDAVIQYATQSLGFSPQDVILFAWSIGGYTASWAAMSYPDIRHVVLDATFDDLLPLAVARMPPSLKSVVQYSIRKYLNLVVSQQIIRYPGPVLFIRRSKDEMITTQDPSVISSNRANDLVIAFLKHRYPNIITDETTSAIWSYLAKTGTEKVLLYSSYDIDEDYCNSLLKSHQENQGTDFPQEIEVSSQIERIKMALYLVSQHLRDFDSTHCFPLPHSFFTKPWSL